MHVIIATSDKSFDQKLLNFVKKEKSLFLVALLVMSMMIYSNR